MATNAIDSFSTFSQRKLMQGGAENYARQAAFVTDATLRAAESWADLRSPIWIDAVAGDLVVVAHPGDASEVVYEIVRGLNDGAVALRLPSTAPGNFELLRFTGRDFPFALAKLGQLADQGLLDQNLARALYQFRDVANVVSRTPANFASEAAQSLLLAELNEGYGGLETELSGDDFVKKWIVDRCKAAYEAMGFGQPPAPLRTADLTEIAMLSGVSLEPEPADIAPAGPDRSFYAGILEVLLEHTLSSPSGILTALLTDCENDMLCCGLRREQLSGPWCHVIGNRIRAAINGVDPTAAVSVAFYNYAFRDLVTVAWTTEDGETGCRIYSWPALARRKFVDLSPGEFKDRPQLRRLLAVSVEEGFSASELYTSHRSIFRYR